MPFFALSEFAHQILFAAEADNAKGGSSENGEQGAKSSFVCSRRHADFPLRYMEPRRLHSAPSRPLPMTVRGLPLTLPCRAAA